MLLILLHFLLGLLFTYFGFINATDTVFNPLSIIFLLIATADFYIGFKGLKLFLNRKKE